MHIAARQRPPAGTLYLDHVAHFVPDLGAAAQALEALGFAVTPESAQATQHGPAGTSNRCAMLEGGYLEFLAPTADTPNARRLRAAMDRYRGVHLACFGTPAAEEEHARLAAHG
ncbi:MAG: VOC family protein, partial [Burkholderiales bacterium]